MDDELHGGEAMVAYRRTIGLALQGSDGTRRLARMDGVSTDGRAGVPWWLSNGMLLAYLELD